MIQRTKIVGIYTLFALFVLLFILLEIVALITFPVFYIITGHTFFTLPALFAKYEAKYFKLI